mgnify:CR=1 FL=1
MTQPTTLSHREQAWGRWIDATAEYTTVGAWDAGYDAALTLAASLAAALKALADTRCAAAYVSVMVNGA